MRSFAKISELILCFLSLNSGEEGTYQCFADNRVGTSVSDKVTVVRAYLKEPTNTYVQVSQGKSAIITVVPTKSDSNVTLCLKWISKN